MKQVIGRVLLFASMILMAGCGKKGGAATAQREFVYIPEFSSIEMESNVDDMQISGDTIYFVSGSFQEETGQYVNSLHRMEIGGGETQTVELEVGEGAAISGLHTDPEGNLRCIVQTPVGTEGPEEVFEPEAAGEEGGSSLVQVEVCTVSGDLVSSIDITAAFEGMEYVYINDMTSDAAGNMYITMEQQVFLLDPEGRKQGVIDLDEWPGDILTVRDGRVFLLHYQKNGMCLQYVDYEKKVLGEVLEEPLTDPYGNYLFGNAEESDLIFSKDNQVFTYRFGDAEPTEILQWTDCDIDSSAVNSFTQLENGNILVLILTYGEEGSTLHVVTLRREKGSEVKEKQVLTYGTLNLNQNIKEQIILFNKNNPDYRIEIKEYLTEYTEESFEQAIYQMNAEIMSGNGPDLMDLSNGNFSMYAAKGVLEDLYPYIDNDPELSREDFLENILKTFETDGKLYTLPPSFGVNTATVKASHVNGKNSITLEELIDLMDHMPEEAELYEYANKSSVLYFVTCMNMSEYLDWNTGECRFDSEDFIRAMEFANRFPAEFKQQEDEMSTAARIREDQLIMLNNGINSVQEYQMFLGMFGEPISFVGYPGNKENGSLVMPALMTGINSRSEYKEGAWKFIRQTLTKEYQESAENFSGYGFPVMKSGLEALFRRDMEDEYEILADGTKEKRPKTTWGYDDFEIQIYAATEEEIATVRNLLTSIDTLYQYDQQVMRIINEETEAFFAGQKPVEHVADVIQNRIQIYVNENR